jgi:formylglycine-generating enzyme required for sulfatase activity
VTWPSQQQHLDHPVVCVSWQDANAYITWLRSTTGQSDWRLPTEAEWEKAARWDPQRNTSRLYPWGDTFDQTRANTSESGIKTTTAIGAYPSGASPFGVEDMAGNVWEWTSSLYKPYPYTQSDGCEALESTENRTLRGGSWGGYARGARAAYRGNGGPVGFSGNFGFRLVLARVGAGS